MATSLAFKKAQESSARMATIGRTKQFMVYKIRKELDKLGIKTIHDNTYWTLRFTYRGVIHTVSGYEEDDMFSGYLYKLRYYDSQDTLLRQIIKDIDNLNGHY